MELLGCIGRERELSRLCSLYDGGGAARAALIAGGPGMGKSALVEALVARLPGRVLRGRCGEGELPYGPFRQMAAGDEKLLARLDAADGEGAWDARRAAAFADVAAWLEALAPSVVVVERLDLADDATRDLCAWLLTLPSPPRLLLTSRDDERWLAVERITLAPLDADGVRGFLQSPAVVAWLQAASGGQPRALAERLAGVSTLPHDARLVRAAAAIYGRPAAAAMVARLAGLDDAAAERAIDALVAAGAARRDGELLVVHGDGEAALGAVDEAARRRLHLAAGRALASDDVVRAADHLLRAGAGEEAVDAALTAGDRLERACGFDRAIELYRAAAALTQRADVAERLDERLCALGRQVGAYATARAHAERLRDRHPRTAAAHRRVAELLVLEDRAAAALEALDAVARLRSDVLERGRLAAVRAEALYALGRIDEARAIDVGQAPLDVQLQLGNTHAKALLGAGAYHDAATAFAAQAERARDAGRPFDECRALLNLGIAELRLGDRAAAERRYRAALAVADAAGDLRNRAFILQNLGVLAHFAHDYATAVERFGAALSAFAQLGQRARVAWVALDLASVYLDLNEPARAEAQLERAHAAEAPAVIAIDRAQLAGRIAWRRGELAAATLQLGRALDAARSAGDHDRAVEAQLWLARVALDAGDRAQASEHLDSVGLPASPQTRARALSLRGELHVVGSDGADARAPLEEALALAGRAQDLDAACRAQLWLARACERCDDRGGYTRHLAAARDLYVQLRARVPSQHQAAFAADALGRALSPATPAAIPAIAATATASADARYGRLLGTHPRMVELRRLLDKIAPHESLVLIRGESGTGKELVADALHAASPRRDRPLIKVNCGALVETLLLSELFGHERGAFTGAIARKKGRFEAADGATLFLDEIGDISPKTQVALLRVLADGELVRVGGTQPIRVDVRILCATHRDLEAMVARGQFREDLYYRLRGLLVELPPLRARADDIPALCTALLARFAAERRAAPKTLSADAQALLVRHGWPGNVRELENVIRAVSLFADGAVIGVQDLVDYTEVFKHPVAPPSGSAWKRLGAEGLSLKALKTRIEIECITEALQRSEGNITRAAAILGMKRPRLSQLIKEHGIPVAGEAK